MLFRSHYYENPGGHNVARHYGVTNGNYKLIHFYALGGQRIDDWELFDLKQDPEEMKRVYADPAYEAIQNEMMSELARLREQYKVTPDESLGRPNRNKKKE